MNMPPFLARQIFPQQTMSSTTVPLPFFIECVFTSPSPPVILVNHALSTASPELTVIDQNHREFKNAVRSMADESVLHVYKTVFYNIPGESINKCILLAKLL